MTEEEYLAFEEASAEKHEYVNGRVYAMAGGTIEHSTVCGRAILVLGSRLRSGCRVLTSDARVLVPETRLYTYPDATVLCGRPEQRPDLLALTNPTVVVEVLSPSTEGYDRGAKFAHYRRCASLQQVVFVDLVARRVEVYAPSGEHWILTESTGDRPVAIACCTEPFPASALFVDLDPAT